MMKPSLTKYDNVKFVIPPIPRSSTIGRSQPFRRWMGLVCLLTILLVPTSFIAQEKNQHLEVDLMITVADKNPESAWITVSGGNENEHIDADSKGLVFFTLELGKEYRVKVESKDCLPKTIIFDTTDAKAKQGEYPCDVDLSIFENTRKQKKINTDIPVAVIRWHRLKRDWFHDADYTELMQEKYKEMTEN